MLKIKISYQVSKMGVLHFPSQYFGYYKGFVAQRFEMQSAPN